MLFSLFQLLIGIYNYFETKEEIFLTLSQKEYERWTTDIEEETAAPPRP